HVVREELARARLARVDTRGAHRPAVDERAARRRRELRANGARRAGRRSRQQREPTHRRQHDEGRRPYGAGTTTAAGRTEVGHGGKVPFTRTVARGETSCVSPRARHSLARLSCWSPAGWPALRVPF